MTWTNPKTWAVDELVTADLMNTHLRDNLAHLYEAMRSYTLITHEEPQGTDATGMTNGTWHTRPLNQKYGDPTQSISLNSNQIIVPAGTYWLFGGALGYNLYYHQTRFYDATTSNEVAVGMAMRCQTDIMNRADVATITTFNTQTALELQPRCSTSNTTNGMGRRANFTTEVYAWVHILKLA
jgi:hypothetical protein